MAQPWLKVCDDICRATNQRLRSISSKGARGDHASTLDLGNRNIHRQPKIIGHPSFPSFLWRCGKRGIELPTLILAGLESKPVQSNDLLSLLAQPDFQTFRHL